MWPVLVRQLQQSGEKWMLEELTKQRALTYQVHQEILALDKQLETLAAELLPEELPAGLGELTALTSFVEVMDWGCFTNRKQVGSYIGCCPSERSTGTGQVLGGIDRQGNRRLRSALTEAVWRLIRWEPGWRGFGKWGALLRDRNAGGVRRKKAVIACVRLLFIDLSIPCNSPIGTLCPYLETQLSRGEVPDRRPAAGGGPQRPPSSV